MKESNNVRSTFSFKWWGPFAVFFVVMLARWVLIAFAARDVPFWDQWISDVADVESIADGRFFDGLFAAHYEHRIVFTRLLNRFLLLVDGQWDPLVQMVAAAFIHALAASVLAAWLVRVWTGWRAGFLCLAVAVLYALPHGWQNTLWGFQSGFSFLMLFSLGCFFLLDRADSCRHPAAWAGLGCGLAAVFSLAAGMVTGLAVIAVTGFDAIRSRSLGSLRCFKLGAGALILTVGMLARVRVSENEALWVESFDQFVAVLVSSLAWPWLDNPWAFGLMIAPLLLLGVRLLRHRSIADAGTRASMLLGIWGVAQAASFALARGGAATVSFKAASRYHDLLATLVLANACALIVLLATTAGSTDLRRWIAVVLGSAWALFVGIGLTLLALQTINVPLRDRLKDPFLDARLLTALQRGAGDQVYEFVPPIYRIWHPPLLVTRTLHDASLAEWMPPSLQHPVMLAWRNEPADIMLNGGADPEWTPAGFYPMWGTWSQDGKHRIGQSSTEPFEFGGGWCLLTVALGGEGSAITISFVNEETGRRNSVSTAGLRGEDWEEYVVHLETGVWRIEVESKDGNSWVALTGPRRAGPLGGLTRWARQIMP